MVCPECQRGAHLFHVLKTIVDAGHAAESDGIRASPHGLGRRQSERSVQHRDLPLEEIEGRGVPATMSLSCQECPKSCRVYRRCSFGSYL